MTQFIRNLETYPQMEFELAALHGELYRIYQRIEDVRGKKALSSLSEEIGTTGDRMVHACMLVALAALPLLAEVSETYYQADQPGVFTYDHIELSRDSLKHWQASTALPAYLFNNLGYAFWFEVAENNRVDLATLNQRVDRWAMDEVGAWTHRMESLPVTSDEPGVQRQGGAEEWAPDEELTADQLRQKYNDEEGGEHVDYVRQMWRHEVLGLNVISGYWDWVFNSIQEARPAADQCDKLLHSYMSKDPGRCVTLTQVRPGLFKAQRGEDEVVGDASVASIAFGQWLMHSLTCDGFVELA